jgi:CHAD domain-containing protein
MQCLTQSNLLALWSSHAQELLLFRMYPAEELPRESGMITTHKTATVAVTRRLAPFCLSGARTLLHYLHNLMAEVPHVPQTEDRECVHRVRVASRRLRCFLPLFALCLSRQTCDRWRKQLRRLTRALGEARDIDVQITCVEHVLAQQASREERPGLERLRLRLQQRRHALREPVGQAIERFTTSQLVEEMEQTLMHLVYVSQASGADIPGPYVYRKMRQAVRARLKAFQSYAPYVEHPECSDELHAMRIAAKHLRYILQACMPFYLDAVQEPAHTARTFQTLLGDIHDCDVWAHDLPQFLEEECQRTLVYFGHLEPFAPLVPGIMALQHNRQHYRMQRYQEFVTFWHQVQEQGIWEQLDQRLDAAMGNTEKTATVAVEGTPIEF